MRFRRTHVFVPPPPPESFTTALSRELWAAVMATPIDEAEIDRVLVRNAPEVITNCTRNLALVHRATDEVEFYGDAELTTRFRIHKPGGSGMPWAMDYPDGFADVNGPMGVACSSFAFAVEAFVKASEAQCPMCLKGAVVDTSWGWECRACGCSDVAVGCVRP